MTDPNWLLATMAQSAAALVAIVGGFLVSRVISLSSEKQGLERRVRELQERTGDTRELLDEARHRRQPVSWSYFVDSAADDCARKRGTGDPVELARKHWVHGVLESDEMQEMARVSNGMTREAFKKLSSLEPVPLSLDYVRDQGIEIPKGEERIYQAVIKVIRPPDTAPFSDAFMPPPPSPDVARRDSDSYEKLIAEERQVVADLAVLEREAAFVATEAARVSRPVGLGAGVGVLAYLTLVGVVAPVVALASRPVPASLASRVALVGVFLSGLVVLFGYLIVAVRQLGQTDDT